MTKTIIYQKWNCNGCNDTFLTEKELNGHLNCPYCSSDNLAMNGTIEEKRNFKQNKLSDLL